MKRFPWLWRMLVRFGTRTGISPHNWLMLEMMSRTWWFYRLKGPLVSSDIELRPAAAVSEADVLLCERLLAAFVAATGSERGDWETTGLWAWMLNRYQRELAEPLERRDAPALAHVLAGMFQREYMHGMSVNFPNSVSWLGRRILRLRSLDVVLLLAESLGVVPTESPEQRRAGLMFDDDLPELLERIDRALGFRIDFPDVGAPFGMVAAGHLITFDSPEQIYAATRVDQAIRAHLHRPADQPLRVVEIGAGYGGLCYWLLRARPDIARYTIVDLPIINVLHGYFLSKALGAEAVSLFGEPPAQVTVLPNAALGEVQTPFAVLINKDSMPEMPYDTMAGYLEWARTHCDGFFYSYNNETGPRYYHQREGIPETLARIGGFTRARRDHALLRRGYVEEIFTRTHAGGDGGPSAWRTRSRASA